jgi:succinyl-CoA synthetase beta subunit
MNIHEYQAKAILARYHIPVPKGFVASTIAEARSAAAKVPGPPYFVKAQIHAGGRAEGKFRELPQDAQSGIRLARSIEEVEAHASEMLGKTLITMQTGRTGKPVNRLYIEEALAIEAQFYLSMFVDDKTSRVTFIATTESGRTMETAAGHQGDKPSTILIDPVTGVQPHHGRVLAKSLGLTGNLVTQTEKLIADLYRCFVETDMASLEIDPLAIGRDGRFHCLDAKIGFDPNALYRHPDIFTLRDESQENAREVEASRYDLTYIALDGSIGCIVNGAGFAMATSDLIELHGGEPANFLDIGGSANKEKVVAALRIITADPKIKGILVNVFGGIMRCDLIAEGVIAAVRELGIQLPLVVRLSGTKAELGKQILERSRLDIIAAEDLDDAAEKIVAAVRETYPPLPLLRARPGKVA